MDKKLISLTALGAISTALLGCSNQIPVTIEQPSQSSQQVSAQSTVGVNNFIKSFSEMFFKSLDRDKDGFLTFEEYSIYNPGDISKAAFKKLDKDNDGKISVEDVKASPKVFFSVLPSLQSKEQVRTYVQGRFNAYDNNKDAAIVEDEFMTNALKEFSFFLNSGSSMTQVAMTSYMFEASDKNRDRKLTFSEFEDFYYNITKGIMKACTLGTSSATTPVTVTPEPIDTYPEPY